MKATLLPALAAVFGAFAGVLIITLVVGENASGTWVVAGAAAGAFALSFPFRQGNRK